MITPKTIVFNAPNTSFPNPKKLNINPRVILYVPTMMSPNLAAVPTTETNKKLPSGISTCSRSTASLWASAVFSASVIFPPRLMLQLLLQSLLFQVILLRLIQILQIIF